MGINPLKGVSNDTAEQTPGRPHGAARLFSGKRSHTLQRGLRSPPETTSWRGLPGPWPLRPTWDHSWTDVRSPRGRCLPLAPHKYDFSKLLFIRVGRPSCPHLGPAPSRVQAGARGPGVYTMASCLFPSSLQAGEGDLHGPGTLGRYGDATPRPAAAAGACLPHADAVPETTAFSSQIPNPICLFPGQVTLPPTPSLGPSGLNELLCLPNARNQQGGIQP